jgi:hypothetical protein
VHGGKIGRRGICENCVEDTMDGQDKFFIFVLGFKHMPQLAAVEDWELR